MHKIGIVCLVLVILAAIGGLFLTVQLLDIRGEWLQRVQTRMETREQQAEQLAQAEETVGRLENEANRVMEEWGRLFDGVRNNQITDAQQGTVVIGTGGQAGLGAREAALNKPLPTVHVFSTAGPQSEYVGEFQLTAVDAQSAAAELVRDPLEGEVQSWDATAWRVRKLVPEAWRSVMAEMHTDIVIALQDVVDAQARLATQQAQLAASEAQLQDRLQELQGKPDAPAYDGTGPIDEFQLGLVEALRLEETERSAELVELDRRRRTFDSKYRQLQATIAEIRERVDTLPGSSSSQSGGSRSVSAALR